MTFKLQIETGNAAFNSEEDGSQRLTETHEVARILREAANKLEWGNRQYNLRDVNGNLVGGYAFDEN